MIYGKKIMKEQLVHEIKGKEKRNMVNIRKDEG